MSTLHPVASSLTNFNDTISTISTSKFFPFLASKLPCKYDVHGPHFQINTELFSSHDVCPAFGFFLPAKYTTHLLSCTLATKEVSQLCGCGQILPFVIKRIFPCSFGNKRMRLLTCVYSMDIVNVILFCDGI